MRATHTLHHDDRNGAGTMVTLGDIVEMIDGCTCQHGDNGRHQPTKEHQRS